MAQGRRQRLPSLRALRVFEIVGRLGSFTKAAEELCVTQSAVSRQILALESELGCRLFLREPSGVRMTEVARSYHRNVSAAMRDISASTDELRLKIAGMNVIRLTTLPTLAAHWLVPHIARFKQEHPNVAVDILSSNELFDFSEGRMDAGIRLGLGSWNGLRSIKLFDEHMITVCAPSLAGSIGRAIPDALESLPLLHTTTRPDAWVSWLEFNELGTLTSRTQLFGYQDFFITIQAAILGQGIAVVPAFLVEQEISNGRLIDPFRLPARSEESYFFVTQKDRATSGWAERLSQWLLTNAVPDVPEQRRQQP